MKPDATTATCWRSTSPVSGETDTSGGGNGGAFGSKVTTMPLEFVRSDSSAIAKRQASAADAQSTVSCDVVIVRFARRMNDPAPFASELPVRLVDRSQSSVLLDCVDAAAHCAAPML